MKMRAVRAVAAATALGVTVVGLSGCEVPTVFVVDRTKDAVDETPGDGVCATAEGDCSLRAAVQEANETDGSVVVELAPGATYALSIIGGVGDAPSDDLDTTGNLTIEGNGATLAGQSKDRFVDQRSGSLRIRDLTISNPLGTWDSTLSGVRVASSAVLERVTLDNLSTGVNGGGAAVHQDGGTLAIVDSRIHWSKSAAIGAGAVYQAGGYLLVSGSEIDGTSNPSYPIAGIEQVGGDAAVVNSRIVNYGGTHNVCVPYRGGNICLDWTFRGQAIRAAGHVDVFSSYAVGYPMTRTDDDVAATGSGSVSISGSIVRWCSTGVASAGFNRSDDPACVGASGDGAAADPTVDQIPIGSAPLCNGGPIFGRDRLGIARPQGAGCDIGDVEAPS